jgi:hypothetical protein
MSPLTRTFTPRLVGSLVARDGRIGWSNQSPAKPGRLRATSLTALRDPGWWRHQPHPSHPLVPGTASRSRHLVPGGALAPRLAESARAARGPTCRSPCTHPCDASGGLLAVDGGSAPADDLESRALRQVRIGHFHGRGGGHDPDSPRLCHSLVLIERRRPVPGHHVVVTGPATEAPTRANPSRSGGCPARGDAPGPPVVRRAHRP